MTYCEYCGEQIDGVPLVIKAKIPLHMEREYPFHDITCFERWSTEPDSEYEL